MKLALTCVAIACTVSCGARTDLGGVRETRSACGHSVSFHAFGDDVFFPGVNATPTSGFTWDFWVRAASVPTSTHVGDGATMVVAADGIGCEDIYVGLGSEFSPANRLAFVVDGAGACAARDTSPIDWAPEGGFVTGKWYFVAVSHDYATGESRLYVDGVLVAKKTATVAPIARTLNLTIGRWTDRGQYNSKELDGAIDELHVWGRALTDAEVASEWGGVAAKDGLAFGWHFDEGSGTSASDFVGGGAGTLEKNATWVDGFVGCGL